jgi:hypothetical protein
MLGDSSQERFSFAADSKVGKNVGVEGYGATLMMTAFKDTASRTRPTHSSLN